MDVNISEDSIKKSKWINPAVRDFLLKSLSNHKGFYNVDVFETSIVSHPQVMSPAHSKSPHFIIKNWDIEPGMSVLDLGTGSGIFAVFAGLKGARRIVAADINPLSIECVQRNIDRYSLQDKTDVYLSDTYKNIPLEKFDRIICNAPNWNHPILSEAPLMRGLCDPDYSFLRAVIQGAPKYLNTNGKLLLGFSINNYSKTLPNLIERSGMRLEKVVQQTQDKHSRILNFAYKIT